MNWKHKCFCPVNISCDKKKVEIKYNIHYNIYYIANENGIKSREYCGFGGHIL